MHSTQIQYRTLLNQSVRGDFNKSHNCILVHAVFLKALSQQLWMIPIVAMDKCGIT